MAEDARLTTRIVVAFGSAVSDRVATDPAMSVRMLLTAFRAKRFQTRHLPSRSMLESGNMAANIALEGVTGALEHPD